MPIKMTREEYRAKFGADPDFSSAKLTGATPSKPSYAERVVGDVKGSIREASDSYTASNEGKMNPISAGINIAKNVSGALISPLAQAPGFKQVGEGFGKAGEAIVNTPYMNKVTDELSQRFSPQTLGDASGLLETGLNVSGVEGTTASLRNVSKLPSKTIDVAKNSRAAEYTKNAYKDIVPSADRMVEHQVSKALDLSSGDISNISKSTGNDVGRWMADQNLIRENKANTQAAVKDFYETNYKAVRTEIGKVKNTYEQSSVPSYVDSLTAVKKVVGETPGLEKVAAEVDNLLKKKEVTLNDVQRAKELVDDHFNLYKVTGDVQGAASKQGMANLRSELKRFIETEVKNNTGADIRQMNNNVQTARSVDDAITTRSSKGLTRGMLRIGDLGIFGVGWGMGGPLGGAALLFGKKLLESPTVRLRIARYMDTLSDARKAQIAQELEQGRVSGEFRQFIKPTGSSKTKTKQ